MSSDKSCIIIVRPAAEIVTKRNRTRARFQQTLHDNVVERLRRSGVVTAATPLFGRILLEVSDQDQASAVLGRTFGLGSYSPVLAIARADLPEIVEVGRQTFLSYVA